MLESLTSSKILKYKNTEEGSSGAKSTFVPVWTVPKYKRDYPSPNRKNQTVKYKKPEI